MRKIAVIGRQLSAEKFEVVFDMLEDGVEEGKISYTKQDAASRQSIPEADGYIFIATTPLEGKLPCVHIRATDSEENIVEKVQTLGSLMNRYHPTPGEVMDASIQEAVNAEATQTGVSPADINGIICTVKGKEVYLTKDDLDCIKALMGMCKDSDFVIKEVIINDPV